MLLFNIILDAVHFHQIFPSPLPVLGQRLVLTLGTEATRINPHSYKLDAVFSSRLRGGRFDGRHYGFFH